MTYKQSDNPFVVPHVTVLPARCGDIHYWRQNRHKHHLFSKTRVILNSSIHRIHGTIATQQFKMEQSGLYIFVTLRQNI